MSKSKGVVLTASERKEKALAYRKMGYSFRAIGDLCGVSAQRAHTIVTDYLRELAERCNNSAEELRQLELEKLDAQETRLHQVILALPPEKLNLLSRLEDTLLRVRVQRAKLLGLVVPTQIIVPMDTSQKGRVEVVASDPKLAELVDEAQSWEPPRLMLSEQEHKEGVG